MKRLAVVVFILTAVGGAIVLLARPGA